MYAEFSKVNTLIVVSWVVGGPQSIVKTEFYMCSACKYLLNFLQMRFALYIPLIRGVKHGNDSVLFIQQIKKILVAPIVLCGGIDEVTLVDNTVGSCLDNVDFVIA